jgi:hypothetical protein
MMRESGERRSEFRFPVVLPIEYFKPDDSRILSYALDLSKGGTFISSDDPLGMGSIFGLNLTIPVDYESSKIFGTKGAVAWNKVQPFESNGMGVKFIEPLPESLLLSTLAHKYKTLIRETEVRKLLEEKVEKLESELENANRLAALGRCMEKILFHVSNPILTLSRKLETAKRKMHKHTRMLEGHEETSKEEFKKIITEFNKSCNKIDQIFNDYKTISEFTHIVGDDRETIERKLKRCKC